MSEAKLTLGIDVGSVSVALALCDATGALVRSAAAAHRGAMRECLERLLGELPLADVGHVARTSSTPDWVQAVAVDATVANITTVRRCHPEARSLIVVGGERFSLIRFDAEGNYRETRGNSACAAGTGSFLDQQAEVLGMGDAAHLADAAQQATGTPPKIASRCAVFAKTDLIHAQQAGHSRAAICSGLCHGLASIVADRALAGEPLLPPVVFAGGVAHNRAVREELEALCRVELVVDDEPHLYGAWGAALVANATDEARLTGPCSRAALLGHETEVAPPGFAPLTLTLSRYPDFAGVEQLRHRPATPPGAPEVEVDVYVPVQSGSEWSAVLGIDIGSTSTKAVLVNAGRQVLAGFYTRTAGQPLAAVQAILGTIVEWSAARGLTVQITGAGTTGSGRKLIGAIIGADKMIDEITAHARAACELDPDTDTIIEIGGQDAKFTTLRRGTVTAAVMNTVCAAGTGSFIEEQARRLGCALADYPARVDGVAAPLVSDRCTVFMQRDLNHLLKAGRSVDEALAAALHAVCENYLQKVAREGAIGEHICFQGATAKNRALVAAFEQRLGRPINVSRYCHLTGALGTALLVLEEQPARTAFRGLQLCGEAIPLRNEVCELCANHCKLVLAEVRGEPVAYGFLCGRDVEVERYVSTNRSGFELAGARRRAFPPPEVQLPDSAPTVGLPHGLFMVEDLPLWRAFFAQLGVRTVSSERFARGVALGKTLSRAEFCAPMHAWLGHVAHLGEKVDWVFVPTYLEARHSQAQARRQYCYYTQYASALAADNLPPAVRAKLVNPLITPGIADLQTKARLHAALLPVLGESLSFGQVASAYDHALAIDEEGRRRLRDAFLTELGTSEDVSVVLLGRPYSCLPTSMNKRIPELLAALGVKVFFQDMVPTHREQLREIEELLKLEHWNYAARLLEVALTAAKTPGLYPVLVTNFKCAPDSCTIEFFHRVVDAYAKPYLILELDEHDSAIGYETRLEAGVRAFRNHHRGDTARAFRPTLPLNPTLSHALGGRHLFLPNWDPLSCALVAANLEREGVTVTVLHEDEGTIGRSLKHNNGQCIPLNAIAQSFVETVQAMNLPPAKTALWMMESQIACNIGMYGGMIKALLENLGAGFGDAAIYVADMTNIEISMRAAMNTYFAYMFGGMLRRLGCRFRPYEERAGETDRVMAEALETFRQAMLGRRDKLEAVRAVVGRFLAIPTRPRNRPKVAIFGDMYVRDNDVMNQGLVRFIEAHGGEVITTPYTEYVKIIAAAYFDKWLREGKYVTWATNRALLAAMGHLEKDCLVEFERALGPLRVEEKPDTGAMLARFGVTDRHTGESFDNLLKIAHLLQLDPDIALFVQANPAFCCPSLVTEGMAPRIEAATGVPVVTVTYDGTPTPKNQVIVPYLHFSRRGRAAAVEAHPA